MLTLKPLGEPQEFNHRRVYESLLNWLSSDD
jgi:hypothetical protein